MQIKLGDFALGANLVKQAKNILILLRQDPAVDHLTAAFFLESVFTPLGKNVQLVAKGKIPQVFDWPKEKISPKVEPRKLVISFNWRKNAVEKVSYQLEGENFNFIISPKNGNIAENEIKITSRGHEADLVITLGIPSLMELDEYERDFLQDKIIVNIDNSGGNTFFGRLNLVDKEADAISGLVASFIEKSRMSVKESAADLLLFGLQTTTNNFSQVRDPGTFEAAAFCTRLKKQQMKRKVGGEVNKPRVPQEWLSPKIFRSKQQTS